MKQLTELYALSQKEGFDIISSTHINKKGFCFRLRNKYVISLDYEKIESIQDEKSVLAEEVGHCEEDCLYYAEDIQNPCRYFRVAKAERKAKDWASRFLVPFEILRNCLIQKMQIYEIAEALNIPEQDVVKALHYYHRKNMLTGLVSIRYFNK